MGGPPVSGAQAGRPCHDQEQAEPARQCVPRQEPGNEERARRRSLSVTARSHSVAEWSRGRVDVKIVLCPAVEPERLAKIVEAAGPMAVINAADAAAAREPMRDADAFFGKLTPGLLAVAQRLRWVQA